MLFPLHHTCTYIMLMIFDLLRRSMRHQYKLRLCLIVGGLNDTLGETNYIMSYFIIYTVTLIDRVIIFILDLWNRGRLIGIHITIKIRVVSMTEELV